MSSNIGEVVNSSDVSNDMTVLSQRNVIVADC
jgi:hypothetical protein